MNQHAKNLQYVIGHSVQTLLSSHTDTYTGSNALPGPLACMVVNYCLIYKRQYTHPCYVHRISLPFSDPRSHALSTLILTVTHFLRHMFGMLFFGEGGVRGADILWVK